MYRYGTMPIFGALIFLFTLDLFAAREAEYDPSSKYIEIDGIRVLREDYEAFARAEEKIKNQKVGDNGIGEDSELKREYHLEQQEDASYGDRLPKRCHG